MSPDALVLTLFLQMAIILAVCRAVGWLGRLLGQTQVVSEMVAGVLLGPSLFGLLAPEAQQWLFPRQLLTGAGGPAGGDAHPSMLILYALSQVGLVLYMFLVGIEFDPGLLAGRARGAALVSAAGILAPFTLGALAAGPLLQHGGLFGEGISAFSAAIFLGASMSITAFPMLARILEEKGIARTRMGTLALAAGSIDDAAAWCLLAIVLSTIQGSWTIAAIAVGGGALYALFMLTAGRRLLARLALSTRPDGGPTRAALSGALLVALLAAYVSDLIGIYAVFGAFIAGVAMPRGRFASELRARAGWLTTTLLLPIFFVYSGLNTRLGLLDSPALLGIALLVLLLAVAGKGVACLLAARATGEGWRESAGIGTLMNARGLMELIILNIGLREGIVTPTLFTIMVLMAAVTTLMTSPLFNLLFRRSVAPSGAALDDRLHPSLPRP
ncbi:MAG TPA: cation:proton antiporter [Candidatus Polarisedimenticolia bacterium]|nr:cation:proton antiporter [Candidatus Polarisedimenticolia bacterium]